ncbi:hypothetical protein Cgig2_000720 [Carnegiea gigantea]|uniref:Uncharacterized protein n=1 Tax=Carnegiea gigantea TaxID=171969 RepID=A0A9Q1QG24_9CARY|nr:hypothetical protein Cgig2_000720 [Carnegiea gigantea]
MATRTHSIRSRLVTSSQTFMAVLICRGYYVETSTRSFIASKRKGGPEKSQDVLDHFRETFTACNLHNPDWSLLFSKVKVFHLNAKLSDYLPIHLRLKGGRQEINRNSTKRNFKFENMWALHDGCSDVIKQAWSHSQTLCSALDMERSIKICASEPSAWNSTDFRHVQCKILDLELPLKGL